MTHLISDLDSNYISAGFKEQRAYLSNEEKYQLEDKVIVQHGNRMESGYLIVSSNQPPSLKKGYTMFILQPIEPIQTN